MATLLRRDEVIFLLGAGASVEAGIPDSNRMVHEIEKLIDGDSRWSCYRDLYRYIRSAVFYADGLEGIFGDNVPFNIERLVNVLEELRKKERHVLYPFVGAWNQKLLDVAGSNFDLIVEFRSAIIDILRNQWVALPEKETASYYAGLLRFQEEYGYPLRVFTLNYDLCIEETCREEDVQRGFGDRKWDWRLFDESSGDPVPIVLYKLHGSADWSFSEDGGVTFSDSPSTIEDEDIALIFGMSYKLQYIDPFLFLVYELRRWTLDAARVIVCVGYGFNDDHINGILGQSLRQNRERRLLAVVGPREGDSGDGEAGRLLDLLGAAEGQIVVEPCGAREYFEERLSISAISSILPVERDLISELSDR